MSKIVLIVIPLFLAACTADPPAGSSREGYGPPSSFSGSPSTGMEHFKASGSWGPGNDMMHPATPGSFKGY